MSLELKRNIALNNYGIEALDKLHSLLLTEEEIVYWLYGGTLLGFVRDGGFIADDTDIDIGVWKEKRSQAEECLMNKGFYKNYQISVGGEIAVQRFEYKGVGIDIYYFSKIKDKASHPSVSWNQKGGLAVEFFYQKNAFDSIKMLERKGKYYAIPSNYDKAVLCPLYGNWRSPIPKAAFNSSIFPNKIYCKEKQVLVQHYIPSIHKMKFLRKMEYLLRGRIKRFFKD